MTLREIIEPVLKAEKAFPAGSYEHDQFVKLKLLEIWPKLKFAAELERLRANPVLSEQRGTPMDVEIMRAELMRFSKEELVTELLAALVELASRTNPKNNGSPLPDSKSRGD